MSQTIGTLAVVVSANNQTKAGMDSAVGTIEAGAARLSAKAKQAERGAFLKGEGGLKGGLEGFFKGGGFAGGLTGALSGSFLIQGLKEGISLTSRFPELYDKAAVSAQKFMKALVSDPGETIAKRQQQQRDLDFYDRLREKAEMYADANNRAARAAQEFSRAANLEAASLGKTGVELQRLQLLYRGVALSAEQYQKAREQERRRNIENAIDKNREAFIELQQEIKQGIATLGMTPGQARLFKAGQGGQFADGLKAEMERLEAMQAAQGLLDEDPRVKFKQQRQGLKFMLEEGQIGAKRYAFELEKATKELEKQQQMNLGPRRLEQGTAAANNAIIEFQRQNQAQQRNEQIEKDQLKVLEAIKDATKDTAKAVSDGFFSLVDF